MKVLSLGWGVQSTTLAFMAELGEIPMPDFAVHAVTYESEATKAYIRRWAPRLEGLRVINGQAKPDELGVINSYGHVQIPVFDSRGGQVQRQCTSYWKVRVIKRITSEQLATRGLSKSAGAVEALIGISWDEAHRMKDSNVAYIANAWPLVERRMTRRDCKLWLERNGIEVPPKSSCVFCPFQSQAAWRKVKSVKADWAIAVAADEQVRQTHPKHGSLYVHPARIPLAEAVKIPGDFGMEQLGLCEGIAGCGL